MSLLSAYFLHLRATADAQQGLLASLVRAAAAVARLRGSAAVEPLPDAVLAVAFTGAGSMAKGDTWPRRWSFEMACLWRKSPG